ncbi:Transposable element Tc1 transposase [Araneus ventricosus]|uniref:Transposable element Tc1 transposase n=1 Tax=Araneus ventricosus TaxID=182803 RepID=A0A4Y2BMQ9_ARAVE|nr:Transposable element Tc1 transposase [Araneus ventricosus]
MGRKKPEIRIEMKKLVVDHYKSGKSIRKVSDILKISKSIVFSIISKYRKTGSVENKVRTGRPAIFTPREQRWFVKKITINPKRSAVKLTLEARKRFGKISHPEIVRNILKNHDFQARVARRKPFISRVNQKERLKFARCYFKKSKEFWESVIFVDESKFNVFGSNGKQKVWRRLNTELKLRNLRATVKHGFGSHFVWSCMSSFGTGNLELIDSKVNKYGYLDILKRNIRQSVQKMGILANFKP